MLLLSIFIFKISTSRTSKITKIAQNYYVLKINFYYFIKDIKNLYKIYTIIKFCNKKIN